MVSFDVEPSMRNYFSEDIVGIGLNSQSLIAKENRSCWVIDWDSINVDNLLGPRLAFKRSVVHTDNSLSLQIFLYTQVVLLKPIIIKLFFFQLLLDSGLSAFVGNEGRDREWYFLIGEVDFDGVGAKL